MLYIAVRCCRFILTELQWRLVTWTRPKTDSKTDRHIDRQTEGWVISLMCVAVAGQ